jgi:restriction endonuclease S subunit
LKKFPVLIADNDIQNEIANLVLQSFEFIESSNKLYSQAENLLLEKLGLKDFKVEDDLFYVVNLSKTKSAHRADAEYFQPKYEKIFNYLKCPIKPLEKITEFLNHAKQPPYIDNGEIPIITQKHLGRAFLNLETIADPETKFTNEEWFKKYPQYQLKAGDVLYYSVGAYIGKTNIVLEDLKATAASFITIIRTTKEINPIYLTVVLNSIIGQLQSGKWQSATAQQYIYPKDIKNFKIPILPKPTQQKIADLVQQSHEARKKAKQLLEEAKREVEKLIEKN